MIGVSGAPLDKSLMGLFFLGVFWVAAVVLVLGLLNYYRNPRTLNHVIGVIVFLGFLFPFSISFVLPIDVSSVKTQDKIDGHLYTLSRLDIICALQLVERKKIV